MRDMTTYATITAKQIRTLRAEADAAGDLAQVDLCNRALTKDGETVDQDGNTIALADMTQADAAAECARVIADAAAQDSEPPFPRHEPDDDITACGWPATASHPHKELVYSGDDSPDARALWRSVYGGA